VARTPDATLKLREKRKRHWAKLKADPKRYKKYKDRRKAREQRYKDANICITCKQKLPAATKKKQQQSG
jgi:hypothetical protein